MATATNLAPAPSGAPAVTVILAPALLNLFPEAPRRVELNASTVDEMMDQLNERWPGMRDRLCDSRPSIRRHINVFVAGTRAKLDTALKPGSEVYVLTAVSGG